MGWAPGSNCTCRVAFFRDLRKGYRFRYILVTPHKQRTKLKLLLISKISSGVWEGGEIRCLGGGGGGGGGGYPSSPLLYESLLCHAKLKDLDGCNCMVV